MKIELFYVPSVQDFAKTSEEHYYDATKCLRKKLAGCNGWTGIYLSEAGARSSVERNKVNFPHHKYYEFSLEVGDLKESE